MYRQLCLTSLNETLQFLVKHYKLFNPNGEKKLHMPLKESKNDSIMILQSTIAIFQCSLLHNIERYEHMNFQTAFYTCGLSKFCKFQKINAIFYCTPKAVYEVGYARLKHIHYPEEQNLGMSWIKYRYHWVSLHIPFDRGEVTKIMISPHCDKMVLLSKYIHMEQYGEKGMSGIRLKIGENEEMGRRAPDIRSSTFRFTILYHFCSIDTKALRES